MNTTDPEPPDDRDAPATGAPAPREGQPLSRTPFDWQVLLLRYLPEPRGSTHAIKRLAPR